MLSKFINEVQLEDLELVAKRDDYFKALLQDWEKRIKNMPVTYQQDGKGDEAVVYLHYFIGNNDWFILEKDVEEEQLQAFGITKLQVSYEAEYGYISIKELLESGAKFDINWSNCKVKELEI